jgi:hypothetical protein
MEVKLSCHQPYRYRYLFSGNVKLSIDKLPCEISVDGNRNFTPIPINRELHVTFFPVTVPLRQLGDPVTFRLLQA